MRERNFCLFTLMNFKKALSELVIGPAKSLLLSGGGGGGIGIASRYAKHRRYLPITFLRRWKFNL